MTTSPSSAGYRTSPAFHYTAAKWLAKSPAYYRWMRDHPPPSSDAQIRGSATHALALEGEAAYLSRYVTPPITADDLPDWMIVAPDHCIGKSGAWLKAGKEWVANLEPGVVPVKPTDLSFTGLSMRSDAGKEWKARCAQAGLDVLSHDVDHHIREAVGNLRNHPIAGPLIADALTEQPVYAEIEGVECKCLIDICHQSIGLADLKTCGDVRPSAFSGDITSYHYDWQAALYLDIVEAAGLPYPPEWRWVTLEIEPPYHCEVGRAPLSLIEVGRAGYLEQLRRFKHCLETDHWPATTGMEVIYDLRGWKYHDG